MRFLMLVGVLVVIGDQGTLDRRADLPVGPDHGVEGEQALHHTSLQPCRDADTAATAGAGHGRPGPATGRPGVPGYTVSEVLAPCRSLAAATASCWVSRAPAANTWSKRPAPERLPDLGHQLGLSLPQHRPRPQPGPAAQALGRPGHQRRPLGVARHERPPGERGQARGHAAGAVGRQARAQRLVQQRPGLLRPGPEPAPGWPGYTRDMAASQALSNRSARSRTSVR